jgi:1,4-dihydroxy-2-naphthoate polyprenyltransferase
MRSRSEGALNLPGEPSLEALRLPGKRYLMATRPSFLTITLAGCLLGMACAHADGASIGVGKAVATMLLALTAHAAVNVHNDYCDHLNGTDAVNTGRIFPFTGGSRFIQNGVLSPQATARYAQALFAFTIIGGLALVAAVGVGLLAIGMIGVLGGWAYSAAPLRLNSRGLGEICIVLSFALVVVGADFVQRESFSLTPLWAGLGYALMTTNVLYINQFPDRSADIVAAKLHWVARLPVRQARWGYVLIALLAAAAMLLPVLAGVLPGGAALGLLALIPASQAARALLAQAETPQTLGPAIRLTIAAAHVAALAMTIGLWWQY